MVESRLPVMRKLLHPQLPPGLAQPLFAPATLPLEVYPSCPPGTPLCLGSLRPTIIPY